MPDVMGQGYHGLRAITPESLILDVGLVYFGIDESKLALNVEDTVDQAIANAVSLGATRGNSSYSSGKEVHEVEVNGARFPLKGMKRIDAYAPTLTVTFLEHTEANLRRCIANYLTTSHSKFVEHEHDVEIADSDYINNVALLTKISGKETPILLVLRNVMAVNEWGLELEDKNEAATEIQLLAHALLSAPHDSPVSAYFPNDAAS